MGVASAVFSMGDIWWLVLYGIKNIGRGLKVKIDSKQRG
jgi:hypothetical protein